MATESINLALQALKQQDPNLEWKVFSSADSSCLAFTKKNQFKDLPNAVVIGFLNPGSDLQNLKTCFQDVISWARQAGYEQVVGPMDATTYMSYRLRTDHFSEPTFYGEPHNDAQLLEIFQSLGFVSCMDYESFGFRLGSELREQMKPFAEIEKQQNLTQQLQVIDLNEALVKANLKKIYDITDEIFRDNFAYSKVSFDLFAYQLQKEILPRTCFQTSKILCNDQGEWIGYSLNLKDANFPKTILIKTIGVVPKERRMGMSFFFLVSRVFEAAFVEYSEAMFCLMRSGNFPSMMSEKLIGQRRHYSLLTYKL